MLLGVWRWRLGCIGLGCGSAGVAGLMVREVCFSSCLRG